MMNANQKIQYIVTYIMHCGCKDESIAVKKATELVGNGDSMSLLARHFDRDKREWQQEDFVENFSCFAEYQGWIMDKANADMLNSKYEQSVLLEANDPFYNSIWGQIPDSVAKKCCIPVQNRIAQGM